MHALHEEEYGAVHSSFRSVKRNKNARYRDVFFKS